MLLGRAMMINLDRRRGARGGFAWRLCKVISLVFVIQYCPLVSYKLYANVPSIYARCM